MGLLLFCKWYKYLHGIILYILIVVFIQNVLNNFHVEHFRKISKRNTGIRGHNPCNEVCVCVSVLVCVERARDWLLC